MLSRLNIPFMKFRWFTSSLSIILVVASIFLIATRGLNYGIDFKGGAKLEYQFPKDITESDVRAVVSNLGLGDITVVRYGPREERRMSIRVEMPEMHAKIAPVITKALTDSYGEVLLESEETVGPKVGAELRRKAWLTILFSWLLMLVYIGYRFNFYFAPGAVIALIHDVLITLGIFALLGKEINLAILAAILTIIGYSVNDTIVVFDRIRENSKGISSSTVIDIVNKSLNSTLSRTLITSLTSLFVILVLFLKGGGTLHNFAFALLVGVVVGTYSSIFVASPIFVGLYRALPKFFKTRR